MTVSPPRLIVLPGQDAHGSVWQSPTPGSVTLRWYEQVHTFLSEGDQVLRFPTQEVTLAARDVPVAGRSFRVWAHPDTPRDTMLLALVDADPAVVGSVEVRA